MAKKRKNTVASFGGFEITRDKGNDHEFLRLRSIAGDWGLSFRNDSRMFGLWEEMCRNKEYHKGAEVMCVMAYYMTNALLDKTFVSEFFDSLDRLHKRQVEAKKDASRQEHDDAISELETLEKLAETMKSE